MSDINDLSDSSLFRALFPGNYARLGSVLIELVCFQSRYSPMVCCTINSGYEEVIHWKPNLFLVPYGSAGTSFVNEVARLFQGFDDGSCLERVSMKAITLIQILLLQKPSKRSKMKDHICHLKRRLVQWSSGDIIQLLDEGRCIQTRLRSQMAPSKNDADGFIFRSLMAQGKVRNALTLVMSLVGFWD